MKLDRLLEISRILLNGKTVTAGELARRFEVSTRTIYRDIDVLSLSGFPVYTTKGTGGGISIMEHYTINRTALSDHERESILFAVKTLQATKYPEADVVLEKLLSIFKGASADWISIDFSPWGADPNTENRFADIKNALLQSRSITFNYISNSGEKSCRTIYPLQLVFKENAWYLWGFCLLRQDFRTFKIPRISHVILTDQTFDRKAVLTQENHASADKEPVMIELVLEFAEEARYRLYDSYDVSMLKKQDNGHYHVTLTLPESEWIYGYLLSFGETVRVLSPSHVQKIIKEKAKKILAQYESD